MYASCATLFLLLILVKTAEQMIPLTETELAELRKTCGRRASSGTFNVYSGNRANEGEFPWAVVIHVKLKPISAILQVCTGTIISQRHILTSSHCFPRNLLSTSASLKGKIYAFGGSACYNCSSGGKVYVLNVRSVVMPNSTYQALAPPSVPIRLPYTDLAIMELMEPIQANLPNLRPICLDDSTKPLPSRLTVYGFGISGKRSDVAGRLHHFTMKFENETCTTSGSATKTSEKEPPLCGAFFKTHINSKVQQQSICDCDSGGGVTAISDDRHYIYGTVSHGDSLCDTGSNPTVLTQTFNRVSYHHNFVCAHTGVCPLGYKKCKGAKHEPALYIGHPDDPEASCTY